MSNENHLDPKAINGMVWRLRELQKENDDAGFANQLPEGAGTSIYGQAADMIYALHAARAAEAPITRTKWLGPFTDAGQALDETRRAVAALLGADSETWPTHGNAPLAIAAVLANAQRKQIEIPELTEEMVDAARPLFQGLECGIKTVEGMRDKLCNHIPRIDPATLPEWFRKETGHLTKAGRAIVAWHLMVAAARKPGATA